MGDSTTFVLGFVNIIENAWLWEASCRNVKAFHRSLVDEIISSTTIKKCVFGHFVFVEKKANINAILSFTNIHGTYLRSLNQGCWSKRT